MERRSFLIATTLTMCTVFAVLPLLAQITRPITVHVPFDFVAVEKTLPAGEYTLSQQSNSVILIRSTDQKQALFVITQGTQSAKVQEQAKLVFDRFGDRYFLSEVWSNDTVQGQRLSTPVGERLLTKDRHQGKVVILEGARQGGKQK